MSVLVDTNILIDLLNGHPQARNYLRSLGQITISAITQYEVLAGCTEPRGGQLKTAEMLLSACTVIPVSADISSRAAQYQRKQKAKRKMADFLIEATAQENGLQLATRNPQDFKHAKTILPYTL
jgi:predicted nucleic acid-binding protein